MGDSTEFVIDIPVTGASSAAAAARAVTDLADQLTAAGTATAAASEAMKAGEAAYKASEAAANTAALAVEKIGVAMETQSAKAAKAAADYGIFSTQYQKASEKLQALTLRQTEAAAKSAAATAAMNAQAATVAKLEASFQTAARQEDNLTKAHEKAKAAAEAIAKAQQNATGSGKVNEVGEAFGKLGGPLGALGQKAFGAAEGFKKMGASLGSAGPYVAVAVAIIAIATAAVTLAAAAAVGVSAITAWGVGLADAARSQQLLIDGIAKGNVVGGELADAIEHVADTVPLAADELAKLAKPLIDAGLRGAELSNALQDAANEAAEVKFGPEFSKAMNSLPQLTSRLQRNFSRIFSGLKIEALLDALSKMVSLFDKGTQSSEAIKTVFEKLFQPLVDGLTAFIPKMISAFIQFEILVLKALIAIFPFGKQIEAVGVAFLILAGIVALMAVGFTAAVIAPFAIITGLAVGLILAVRAVAQSFIDFYEKLKTMSLAEIGVQMMTGLAEGITSSAASVVAAITGAVNGAVTAAKKALGIASPSKVFAEIGMHTAAGMEEGIDDGAAGVSGSMESMVAPPDAAASGAKPAGGSSLAGAVFNFYGVKGAEDSLDMLRAGIAEILMQTGGAT